MILYVKFLDRPIVEEKSMPMLPKHGELGE